MAEDTGINGNGHLTAAEGTPSPETLELTLRTLEMDILLARAQFMRQAGITFGGARDEYEVLGYDRNISDKQFRDEYARGGIAGRVVDVMPDATWRGEPAMELVEDEDPEKTTPFEEAWQLLDKQHQICSKLQRVDRLARLSTFAVLLIGAMGNLEEELPRATGVDKLLYLTPFSGGGAPNSAALKGTGTIAIDADATVAEYVTDTADPRFGLPRSYYLKRTDFSSPQMNRPVHWTRIIHVAEGLLDNEVFGQPALERVWNLLIDLRKVTGGGAEAFWLRANQGLHLDVDKDMALADVKDTIDKLKEQAEAYKHQLTRWLRTRGVKVDTLGSDVANFSQNADAILTQIAGAKAIPKRILTGSEMGELASSQDRENFRDQVIGRQMQYAGPVIVRQLADRLIKYGYLPTPAKGPNEYMVKWPHTQVMTEQEKVTGAQGWAEVNQAYGDVVFTDAEIREKWAGKEPLDEEQKQEVLDAKMQKVQMAQEAMARGDGTPAPGDKQVEDANKGKPPQPNPFARRAAEMVEDRELLRVLVAALKAGNADVVERIIGLQHEYGTTQVQLPPDVAGRLFNVGRTILDEDIYEPEGGRETDAHVTVRYGLMPGVEPKDVFEVVARRGPVTFVLGRTCMFSTPNYDVVYVAVVGPELGELHTAIGLGVPCKENDYGIYYPHATVAYVKPGTGHKYTNNAALDGTVVTVDSIVVSDVNGTRTEVSLRD